MTFTTFCPKCEKEIEVEMDGPTLASVKGCIEADLWEGGVLGSADRIALEDPIYLAYEDHLRGMAEDAAERLYENWADK